MIKKLHPYVEGLVLLLKEHNNITNAHDMEKYMRNRFKFFGITSEPRRALLREYMKKEGLPAEDQLSEIITQFWNLPYRELHYCTVELLVKTLTKYSKKPVRNLPAVFQDPGFIEFLIVHNSWWDTVDAIAVQLAGLWLKMHPGQIKQVTGKWIRSDNMWLQRSALLFQLKYKKETDTDLLFSYIKKHASSKEFFIEKAIGWALREYSKTDPAKVQDFVKHTQLRPLSVREASRIINKNSLLVQ
jgi:3-methyladenine DNA glycosylase AlkD